MNDYLTWDFNKFVTTKKENKMSRRMRIDALFDKVTELESELAIVKADLGNRTKVNSDYHSILGFMKMYDSMPSLYASEAIRMIMNHLDMRFEFTRQHYSMAQKPEPIEIEEDNEE